MSELRTPGIYVDEVSPQAPPINGVDTSTTAFLGIDGAAASAGGLQNFAPREVRSLNEAIALLGAPVPGRDGTARRSLLADALRLYFGNGGRIAWLLRLPNAAPATIARGLELLRQVPAGLLAAPDIVTQAPALREAAQRALVAHCEDLGDRMTLLDAPLGAAVADLLAMAVGMPTAAAALYAPWLQVDDTLVAGQVLALPPSAALAGIYARVDTNRGVFRAPANEAVSGARGLATTFSAGDQAQLNPAGVNGLRVFPGRGLLVWGARTLATDPQRKYVALERGRRFIQQSLARGMAWTAFEPDGEPLRARVRMTADAFLGRLWRDGALMGRTPSEAWFFRCDATTTTAADLAAGRLVAVYGMALTRPAEFMVDRVTLRTAH